MKRIRPPLRAVGASRKPSRLAAAFLLVVTALTAPAAEPGAWELVSPDGGSIVQLARGDEARTVYALSTLGGLFRSTDGGERWAAVTQQVGGLPIRAVGPSPADPDLLLADNGLLQRSTDGGATWVQTNDRFSSASSFTFAPSDPSRVYAAGQRIWRSDDAGASWTAVDQAANEIVVDEADPDRLWAGFAGGVAYSDDGGASWVNRLTSVFVSHLAIDRGDPHTLWAAAFSGLWVSEDDGMSWAKKLPPAPLRETIRQVVARTDVDGEALVVASRYTGQSQNLEADVAFYVSGGGDTWIALSERPREILALLPVVEEPVFVPGLFAPRGHGIVEGPFRRSGFVTSIGLQATKTGFFAIPDLAPSTVYAHDAAGRDLLTSRHGGKLWQRRPLDVAHLMVAPSDPAWLYATTGTELLRSVDGGRTFTAVPLPTGVGFYQRLAVHPVHPDVLRLVMTVDTTESCGLLPGCPVIEHRVFASGDAGATWRPVATPGAPQAPITDLRFDPRSPAGEAPVEYLLTVDELFVRDPSQGGDWLPVGDPALRSAAELAAQTTKGGGLALYVRTWRQDEPVWRTTDGGASWRLLSEGFPADPDTIPFALAAAPRPGGRVVVGTARGGVFHLVGERWEPLGDLGPLFVDQLAVAAGSDVTFARAEGRLYRYGLATDCVPPPAGDQAAHLCLGAGDRFRVEIDWQDFQGGFGVGRGEALTRDAGYFWFFRPTNAELAVKVLDGRTVNGNHWVFYGALTNVPFDLTVTDTREGDYQTYSNPLRIFASRGDTAAFPADGIDEPVVDGLRFEGDLAPTVAAAEPAAGCPADERILCLHGGRFLVEADWEDFQGGSGTATPVPLTSDSGYLWFFRQTNLELFVKVLDGRPVNGHWWVFYGSLSNVAFELRVTDTLSGVTNTYLNPSGSFASRGDDTAFDPVQ